MDDKRGQAARPREAAAQQGPAWLLALAAVLGVVAVVAMAQAARIGYAAWLVFPGPEIQPSLERAVPADATVLPRLTRVNAVVPGDSRYAYLLAEAERRQARTDWFGEAGDNAIERARQAAHRAVELVPTNPYYYELLGGILLDSSKRASASTGNVTEALEAFRTALSLAPGSPVLYEHVGHELLRAWVQLDDAGKELTADALRAAAGWDGAMLPRTYDAIALHLPLDDAIPLAGRVTPVGDQPALRLDTFLRRLAHTVPAASPQRTRLAELVVDAGIDQLRRSDYPSDRSLDWALWSLASFAQMRPRMVQAMESALENQAGAPGPVLALSVLHEAAEARVEAAERAVELLEPEGGEPYLLAMRRLATVLEQAEQPERAVAMFQTLADLTPQDAEPLVEAARVLQGMGRRPEAIDALETAVSRDPLSLQARRALGAGYFDAAMFRRAIETWRYVTQRAARDAGTRARIARAHEALGELDDAERYLEIAAELDARYRDELTQLRARLAGIQQ